MNRIMRNSSIPTAVWNLINLNVVDYQPRRLHDGRNWQPQIVYKHFKKYERTILDNLPLCDEIRDE